MTGIGRYVRHYSHVGAKLANVVLSVDLTAGTGDGFVQLIAKTRNRSGIAAGSVILLNFGVDYDHAAVTRVLADDAQQPKRIRTMLDAYFKKLGEQDAEAAAGAVGEAAAISVEAAGAKSTLPAAGSAVAASTAASGSGTFTAPAGSRAAAG